MGRFPTHISLFFQSSVSCLRRSFLRSPRGSFLRSLRGSFFTHVRLYADVLLWVFFNLLFGGVFPAYVRICVGVLLQSFTFGVLLWVFSCILFHEPFFTRKRESLCRCTFVVFFHTQRIYVGLFPRTHVWSFFTYVRLYVGTFLWVLFYELFCDFFSTHLS